MGVAQIGLGALIVKSIFGGGKSGKVADATPVSTAAIDDTEDAKKKAKASRAALFETEGGAAGSPLDPNNVQQRGNLFGN